MHTLLSTRVRHYFQYGTRFPFKTAFLIDLKAAFSIDLTRQFVNVYLENSLNSERKRETQDYN